MIYSYTQIAQYLRCPRSYRFRYLDGWSEKETGASMLFGRCFEKALATYFRGDDCTAVLFKEWEAYRDGGLAYANVDSWDKLVRQGVHLLEMFARDDRIRIPHPEKNLQLKMLRSLPNGSEFVAHIDAIGKLDGQQFLIDWKTTASRYPEEQMGCSPLIRS